MNTGRGEKTMHLTTIPELKKNNFEGKRRILITNIKSVFKIHYSSVLNALGQSVKESSRA
jgi:hypothetical protein